MPPIEPVYYRAPAAEMIMKSGLLLLAPFGMAFIAGAFVSAQAAINSSLGKALGHPLWGALASLIVSLVVVSAALLTLKIEPPALRGAPLGSWWLWTGGLAGAIYLASAATLPLKMGASSFILLVIAGQITVSVLTDQFGLFGIPAQPVGHLKYIGVLLMIVGLAVSQLDPKA